MTNKKTLIGALIAYIRNEKKAEIVAEPIAETPVATSTETPIITR